MSRRRNIKAVAHLSGGALASYLALTFLGQIAWADARWQALDVPGDWETQPAAINDSDVVAGSYENSRQDHAHGFVRAANGVFATFDAGRNDTVPTAINAKGSIAGWYDDKKYHEHGFVRAPDGTIATFDVAGATDTTPSGINAKGTAVGYWNDGHNHGFLRTVHEKIETFDAPQATDTYAYAINDGGAVTGGYVDSAGVSHGYVRAADGSFASFDIPGVTGFEIEPTGINASGEVAGYYTNGYNRYGFLRDAAGKVTTVDPSGFGLTYIYGINDDGAVVGAFEGNAGAVHGFRRAPHGRVTLLDFPGAVLTFALGIDKSGETTGEYAGTDGIYHGFLLKH